MSNPILLSPLIMETSVKEKTGTLQLEYEEEKKQILRDGYMRSIHGGAIHDTKLYVQQHQGRSPRTTDFVAANSDLLRLASPKFSNLLRRHTPDFSQDDYFEDSDLEDPEEGLSEEDFEDVSDSEDEKEDLSNVWAWPTPPSSGPGSPDGARSSSPSSQIYADLDGLGPMISRSGSLKKLQDMLKEWENRGIKAEPKVVKVKLRKPRIPTYDDGIYVKFGSLRTWQALILYLYTDEILFHPLQSRGIGSPSGRYRRDFACSPKSMYRLARQFGLGELQQASLKCIRRNLNQENIIGELFSLFTSRFTEVIKMELEVFCTLSTHETVQRQMSYMIDAITRGKYPHTSCVLKVLLVAKTHGSIFGFPVEPHCLPSVVDIRSAMQNGGGEGRGVNP